MKKRKNGRRSQQPQSLSTLAEKKRRLLLRLLIGSIILAALAVGLARMQRSAEESTPAPAPPLPHELVVATMQQYLELNHPQPDQFWLSGSEAPDEWIEKTTRFKARAVRLLEEHRYLNDTTKRLGNTFERLVVTEYRGGISVLCSMRSIRVRVRWRSARLKRSAPIAGSGGYSVHRHLAERSSPLSSFYATANRFRFA